MRDVRAGQRYRHFKGNIYIIIAIAKHTETMEKMVVYQEENDINKIWVRPLDMFNEEVDHEKYPDVTDKYRFTRLS